MKKSYGKLNKYKKILENAIEYQSIYERVKRIKSKLNDFDDIKRLERKVKVIENELQ